MTPEDRDRGIRRAIEADELDDLDIAAEFEVERSHVSRLRTRMRRELEAAAHQTTAGGER
jgi:hypothetical protein